MTVHGHKHEHKKHVHVAPAHVTVFINTHATEAQIVGMKYDIPASVILAQSAVESDWGRNAPGNAFFGIKGKAPDGASVQISTHEEKAGKRVAETDAFRAYKSYEDAADNYGTVITTNKAYAHALANRHDPNKFIDAVAKSYATDHSYATKVKSIIKSNNLTQYDH